MPAENDKYAPTRKTHDAMVKEWMRDPAFKTEYNALEKEYELTKGMVTKFIP